MQWDEAYRRAGIAVASGLIIYLGGIIAIAIGYWIGDSSDNIVFTVLGILVASVGFLFILLGLVAVWLKVITDSMVDYIKADLSDQIEAVRQEVAASNQPAEADVEVEQPADEETAGEE